MALPRAHGHPHARSRSHRNTHPPHPSVWPGGFNLCSDTSSGSSKLLAATLSVAKEEPGPKAEATKAGPGREFGAGSAVASTLGSKLGGKWTQAKQVTDLDGKPPESQQMDWGKPLNDVQRLERSASSKRGSTIIRSITTTFGRRASACAPPRASPMSTCCNAIKSASSRVCVSLSAACSILTARRCKC